MTSAWGSPARACHPSPPTAPARSPRADSDPSCTGPVPPIPERAPSGRFPADWNCLRHPESFWVFAGLVARKQRQLIFTRFATTPMTAQLVDFGAKRFDVLKAVVDGSEAHIPHLVEMPKLLHHHLADTARCDFALAQTSQFMTNPGGGSLDRFAADGPLLQGPSHSGEQLVLIERLAAAVALDHGGQQQFRRFKCREAFRALETFAPPTNLAPFAGEARVDDLSFRVTAKWAMHGDCLGGVRGGS